MLSTEAWQAMLFMQLAHVSYSLKSYKGGHTAKHIGFRVQTPKKAGYIEDHIGFRV